MKKLLFILLFIPFFVFGQNSTIEFGIYDREDSTILSSNWISCDITTLTNYWSEFVEDYNDSGI